MMSAIRKKLLLLSTVFAMLHFAGCEVGRTWFQMNSNSPTPFMGIDLLPRRTSQLEPPQPIASEKLTFMADRADTRQVSERRSARVTELKLPHVTLFQRAREEELTFQGPEPIFSR